MSCSWLTTEQVKEYLQLKDRVSVYNLTKQGFLKAHPLGTSRKRYCLEEIQRAMGVEKDD